MTFAQRSLAALAVVIGAVLAGCGSSAAPPPPVSGSLVDATSTSPGHIVLSALGAERIGLQTGKATAVPPPAAIRKTTIVGGIKHTTTTRPPAPAGSPTVIVPYSSVIYDPSGKTYVFTNTARLTYVETPVSVAQISGARAYLTKGPKAGSAVVTIGAEELFGVQTGVLAQT